MPHDSLPRGGPGRIFYEGPFGDFFLSEITLTADGSTRIGDGIEIGPKMHLGVGAELRVIPLLPLRAGVAAITDGVQVWGLNHTYFATLETAQWIANRYGTGQTIEVPFGGNGGPFSASATEYHIRLADGRVVNAGILAGYYERNPEALFPGLADKLIRAQLAQG